MFALAAAATLVAGGVTSQGQPVLAVAHGSRGVLTWRAPVTCTAGRAPADPLRAVAALSLGAGSFTAKGSEDLTVQSNDQRDYSAGGRLRDGRLTGTVRIRAAIGDGTCDSGARAFSAGSSIVLFGRFPQPGLVAAYVPGGGRRITIAIALNNPAKALTIALAPDSGRAGACRPACMRIPMADGLGKLRFRGSFPVGLSRLSFTVSGKRDGLLIRQPASREFEPIPGS